MGAEPNTEFVVFKERDNLKPVSGARDYFSVPVGELANGAPVLMPVMAVCGLNNGPTVLVTSCVHGDEILGAQIVRGIAASLDPRQMRGTFIGIPMVNMGGVATRSRRAATEIYPGPYDMNRIFPGNAAGGMAERVAHIITETFIKTSDFVLDLHQASTGAEWLPYAIVPKTAECASEQTHQAAVEVAKAFGAPLLLEGSIAGSLIDPALRLGVPATMVEFGVAGIVDQKNVDFGKAGIMNLLRHAGVVEGVVKPAQQTWIKKLHRMTAQRGGFLSVLAPLGAEVSTGQSIAEVQNLQGEVLQNVVAPESGVICRVNTTGIVATGDPIAHVGVS
jgi:predicted deacylase